jgi:hypothetical protein
MDLAVSAGRVLALVEKMIYPRRILFWTASEVSSRSASEAIHLQILNRFLESPLPY